MGGWYDLLAILKEGRELKRELDSQRPPACPRCGEPLLEDPRETLRCKFDGWTWDGVTGQPTA